MRWMLALLMVFAGCGRSSYDLLQSEVGEAEDAAALDAGAPADAPALDAAVSPQVQCCVEWCQDGSRFGGATYTTDSFTASADGCSSSTGCTCAASAFIANTWTVITGNICDAHDFATSCPGNCDGNQCPVIDITGRWDEATNSCTCVGTDTQGDITLDIWNSDCAENTDNTPFDQACPIGK